MRYTRTLHGDPDVAVDFLQAQSQAVLPFDGVVRQQAADRTAADLAALAPCQIDERLHGEGFEPLRHGRVEERRRAAANSWSHASSFSPSFMRRKPGRSVKL